MEIDIAGRSISMVGRGIAFFCAVFMAIIFLGLFCHMEKIVEISMFDMVFLSAFVFGGSFPFLISYCFLESVEDNTNKMVILFLIILVF